MGSEVLNTILRNWQASTIVSVNSGPPFTLGIGTVDASNTGLGTRANCVGHAKDPRTLTQWYNPSNYAIPSFYSWGNCAVNTERADGRQNVDFSAAKNIPISDRFHMQFRAEFFNLFNHPNFGGPVASIDVPTAGLVTSATPGREIQFGLKLLF